MLNLTKPLLALCAIAASGIVYAQTAGGGPTGMGGSQMQSGGGGSTGKDPFIENREEKSQARKEYKKDKSISKQDYSQEKKKANQKLKQSGAQSEGTKNTEVPSTR